MIYYKFQRAIALLLTRVDSLRNWNTSLSKNMWRVIYDQTNAKNILIIWQGKKEGEAILRQMAVMIEY